MDVRQSVLLAVLFVPSLAAQSSIPIRRLSEPEASSAVSVMLRASARVLSDGRVLVNDPFRPKLTEFDHTLSTSTVIADSTTLTAGSRPVGTGALSPVAYIADSTLLVDGNAQAFIVLDPSGKSVRTMAPTRPLDILWISSTLAPNAGLDSKARLIYRGTYPPHFTLPAPGTAYNMPSAPDSFPLVRGDFDTRLVDTLGSVAAPTGIRRMTRVSEDRKITSTMTHQPLPTIDDWAILSDGSVAIVRGHDYHVDWIYADGSRASTPKMPFDWRPLRNEDKQRLVDSVRAQNAIMAAKMKPLLDSLNAASGRPASAASSPFDGDIVPLAEIPDYYPPIRANSVLADRDANLWILPATSVQARGGLLYDVVNKRGELFERVQIPEHCTLAGFAPDRVVYVVCPSTATGPDVESHLERRRIVQ